MLGRIAGLQAAIGQRCREVAEVLCRACHQEVFGQRLAVILAGEAIGEGAGEAAIPEIWGIQDRPKSLPEWHEGFSVVGGLCSGVVCVSIRWLHLLLE